MRTAISEAEFEKLVSTAIDSLPKRYIDALDNVGIVMADWPDEHQKRKVDLRGGSLFGLYEGIPPIARGTNYSGVLPDKITIFKEPLRRVARNTTHLESLIKNTVWHEIAHHYGLDHDRIHELEDKARAKQQAKKDVDFVQSDALKSAGGVSHGWFTRHGGVSDHPFFSLNVKHRIGDRPEYVEENRRRALEALELDASRLVFANDLAHGARIAKVTEQTAGRDIDGVDAIITDVVDLPISLSVADCQAIFVYDPVKKVIAVAHAGWRGTVANIASKVVKALVDSYGSKPADMIASLGPAIAAESYEVGPEVAEHFDAKYLSGRQLDFSAAIRDQLEQAGVGTVDRVAIDTSTDDRFFSHRGEQGQTGRFAAIISMR